MGLGWCRAVGHDPLLSSLTRIKNIKYPLKSDNPTGTTVFSVNHLPGYGRLKMGTTENLVELQMCCPHFLCTEEKFSAVVSKDVTCSLVLSASCPHIAPVGSALAQRHTHACKGTQTSPAHLELSSTTGEDCECGIQGREERLPVRSSLGRRLSQP